MIRKSIASRTLMVLIFGAFPLSALSSQNLAYLEALNPISFCDPERQYPTDDEAQSVIVVPCPGEGWTVAMYGPDGEPLDISFFLDPDPGLGATKLDIYRWSNGTTYHADSISGLANDIWNAALAILTVFQTTAGSILQALLDFSSHTIDKYKSSTSILRYSHSYPDKNVSVYTASGWVLYVTSRSREWYKHYWGSWADTGGVTRTSSLDFLPPGYPPVAIDYAPHYHDHAWLFNTAYIRWDSGYPPGWLETW